ncbi:unnamed protein product [Bemisia tabaci]|uniref:Uncharacterized protein n=1 Tax=Bemisia tabaci TaxID=7038 RepID=A0A9P0AAR4_BEMTA|nr:unnamed protein product [Bemisia tabaci]
MNLLGYSCLLYYFSFAHSLQVSPNSSVNEADNIMVKTRADSSFGKSDESYEFLSAPLRIRFYRLPKLSEVIDAGRYAKSMDSIGSPAARMFLPSIKRINQFKSEYVLKCLMTDRLTPRDTEEEGLDDVASEMIEEEKPPIRIHFPRTLHKRLSYTPSRSSEISGLEAEPPSKRDPNSWIYWILSNNKNARSKEQKQVRSSSPFRTSAFYATMG